jgi:hypothetical protein
LANNNVREGHWYWKLSSSNDNQLSNEYSLKITWFISNVDTNCLNESIFYGPFSALRRLK